MKHLPSPMEFPVSNDGIRAALDGVLASADSAGIARAVAHRMAVIVDEYCSNLIRHDPSVNAESRFQVTVEPVEGGALLTLCDDASPFDPTGCPPRREREVGGQGIVLIQGLAAALDYDSTPGRNVFRATVLAE